MPARRATSSMVSSCTGVVGSSSRPICTSCARRSPAVRRRRGGLGAEDGGHRPSRGRPAGAAAASSRSIASVTSCGALLGEHVAGPLDDVQLRVGQRLGQLPAVPLRRELVAVADQDLDRHAGQRRRAPRACRGRRGPGMKAMNARTVEACMISRARPAPSRRSRRRRRAGSRTIFWCRGCVGGSSCRSRSTTPRARRGPRSACRASAGPLPPAGCAGPRCRSPADVDTSATPRTRSPNSSGRAAARHMIVMPPIEWPPSTTGPVGRELVEQLGEVVAELVDGRSAASVGSPRSSGRGRAGRSGSAAARRRRPGARAARRRRPRRPGPASSRARGRG